ncbi:MAG: hypothetical protein GX649_09125 [Chloroflexi bacterium]|nr:hypothetical protein [Chloroflexota bacterium]
MASVAKGFNYGEYLGLVARRKSPNIESMSPRARKAYLGRQLRMVEAQIGVVIDRLADESDESPELDWAEHALDEERWSSLFSLGYLVAERDALVEVIGQL